jgi:hypothetical protein
MLEHNYTNEKINHYVKKTFKVIYITFSHQMLYILPFSFTIIIQFCSETEVSDLDFHILVDE